MKPSDINKVLTLAQTARKNGDTFIPCFEGEAGLGKSQIVMQWVKEQQKLNPDFIFLDLRIAFMEQPDLIGFPEKFEITDNMTGKKTHITKHCIPDFFHPFTQPNAKGIIIFEEPNRGTTGVLNCLMQMLTDNKVHTVEFAPEVMMCACINPDNYDVTTMDPALRDRFVFYDVVYDHKTFLDYMERKEFDESIQLFVKSGTWVYQKSHEIGNNARYVSPRTLERLNSARKAGIAKDADLHYTTACAILGENIGAEFHKFCFDQAPVVANDILNDKRSAMSKIKKYSKDNATFGDMIYVTIESISKNFVAQKEDCKQTMRIGITTMAKIAEILPADQSINLMRQTILQKKDGNIKELLDEFFTNYPNLKQRIRENIKMMKDFE